MSKQPDVGAPAPDFTLEGTDGTFTLSEHRGERVLLLFYPGDNTPVCTAQFCSYRDHAEEFDGLGVTAVGISVRDTASKEKFRTSHGLTVPLLADRGAKVAELYGVKGPGFIKRSTFLIDEEGVVRAKKVHALGLQYESVEDLKQMVDSLGRAPATT
jgi:peroxiredoxin Q/BCP